MIIEKYTSEELDCEHCAEFTGRPCPLHECGYIMERGAAGATTLQQLIRECFQLKRAIKLCNRLRTYKEHLSYDELGNIVLPFVRNSQARKGEPHGQVSILRDPRPFTHAVRVEL